jgi:hypothetical protein
VVEEIHLGFVRPDYSTPGVDGHLPVDPAAVVEGPDPDEIEAEIGLAGDSPGLGRVAWLGEGGGPVYCMVTGFRWANVLELALDVVATGNVVTFELRAGFVGGGNLVTADAFNDTSAEYVRIVKAGGETAHSFTADPDDPAALAAAVSAGPVLSRPRRDAGRGPE